MLEKGNGMKDWYTTQVKVYPKSKMTILIRGGRADGRTYAAPTGEIEHLEVVHYHFEGNSPDDFPANPDPADIEWRESYSRTDEISDNGFVIFEFDKVLIDNTTK
jgi:hypothetical protein